MRIVYKTTMGDTEHIISIPLPEDGSQSLKNLLTKFREKGKEFELMLDSEAEVAETNCEGCKTDRLRV